MILSAKRNTYINNMTRSKHKKVEDYIDNPLLVKVMKSLLKEKKALYDMTYDENDEPHDEGILGQITGIETAMTIVERVDNGNES